MENKPFGKVKEVIGDNPDGTTTVKVQVTPLVDPIDIDRRADTGEEGDGVSEPSICILCGQPYHDEQPPKDRHNVCAGCAAETRRYLLGIKSVRKLLEKSYE